MPPKAKFSREEIIQSALAIVKEEGMQALTARALGAKLDSSARPIFTVFQNMEEVQQAVLEAAKKLYRDYIKLGLEETPAFKGVGSQYILFSIKEPKLFQLLFMTEQTQIPDLSHVLPLIDESYNQILASIEHDYGMEWEVAKRLYHHLWIYTHGIAVLCATKMCRFTMEEISVMMTEVCRSLMRDMREDRNYD